MVQSLRLIKFTTQLPLDVPVMFLACLSVSVSLLATIVNQFNE